MHVTNDDASCTLIIAGELHISAADALRDALRASLDRLPELTLDLADVDACDTAALQLLLSAARSAAQANKPCSMRLSDAIVETGTALGLSLEEFSSIPTPPLEDAAPPAETATPEVRDAI